LSPEPVSGREVGLSLGANVGDRLAQLQEAKKRILAAGGMFFAAQSPVYETEPVDVAPQNSALFFLNAVLIVKSPLPLSGLLPAFKRIESQLGRAQRAAPNAPRLIDIDIIYAGGLHFRDKDVIIPHPRWARRRFVVRPLSDVRPELVVPGQTGPVAEVLRGLSDRHKVKLFAKEW
jgi:2-amino-4-hydroxy-6-hydroxymethyldihydropteridine diphosphokinase